jgi:hypothetical protein
MSLKAAQDQDTSGYLRIPQDPQPCGFRTLVSAAKSNKTWRAMAALVRAMVRPKTTNFFGIFPFFSKLSLLN